MNLGYWMQLFSCHLFVRWKSETSKCFKRINPHHRNSHITRITSNNQCPEWTKITKVDSGSGELPRRKYTGRRIFQPSWQCPLLLRYAPQKSLNYLKIHLNQNSTFLAASFVLANHKTTRCDEILLILLLLVFKQCERKIRIPDSNQAIGILQKIFTP